MSGHLLSLNRLQVLRGLVVPLALVLVAVIALSACSTDDTETTEAADRAAQAAERAADAAQRAAAAAEDSGQSGSQAADRAADAATDAAQAAGEAADAASQAADRAAQAAQSASAAASSTAQDEPMEDEDPGELTIYSGRGESLVGPIIERFEDLTGINVRVRYAGTAELAVAILEEGDRSPADIYYAQDAGALAALAENGALTQLPDDIVNSVEAEFADASGRWVATSGRARVLIISPDRVPNPPTSVFDLVDPEWRGRVGWAPTNGSFQAFVTAMRQIHGDEATEQWLRGMIDNDVRVYPKNSPQVQAVHDGELDIGLVNHYYLIRQTSVNSDWHGVNHFTDPGEAGALINIAGVALLNASDNDDNALRFVRFLLSEEGQTYFREETFEYPVAAGVSAWPTLVPLDELNPPSLALTSLSDLEGTIALLEEVGALP